jgi:glyoxylase-like metal-dependent hydrolase (beta-lactamase superfamily II)
MKRQVTPIMYRACSTSRLALQLPGYRPLRQLHQKAAATASITRTSRDIFSTQRALHLTTNPIPKWNQKPWSNNQPSTSSRAAYTTATLSNPTIHEIFEKTSGTWQYLVADPKTSKAVIIDPVLDYDSATQAITTEAADAILSKAKEMGYKIDKILETHAHADHLTAASYLQTRLATDQGFKPPVCIGKRIEQVQTLFAKRYGVPAKEYVRVFDRLFDDDEVFSIGELSAKAIHLPGHTPDHLGYMIGGKRSIPFHPCPFLPQILKRAPENLFCGDSLFHIDIGTARCDFPGGSARDLYASGRKLLSLPDHYKIWTGHDYPPEGRSEPVPWMSVRDHKTLNKHLKEGICEEEFVALRRERDDGLKAPRLLHQSLQINIRAGRLPKVEESGFRFLHVPLVVGGEW